MNENGFNFNKFLNDSKETLINPKNFFPTLKLGGGLGEPIIMALIYGAVAGILYLVWGFLFVGGMAGGMWGGVAGIGGFLMAIIGSFLGLFIGALIVLVLSAICGGNNDFEASLHVTASLMLLFPISALFSVLSGLNFYLGTIVTLAINLYFLYLLYLALTLSLKAKVQTAKILLYILMGLFILGFIVNISGRSAMGRFSRHGFSRYERDLRNLQKELEAESQKDAAEYEVYDQSSNQNKEASISTEDHFQKPEQFPSEAIKQFKEYFSTDASKLSAEKLQKLVDATNAIKGYDKDQSEKILTELNKYGFASVSDYVNDYVAAVSASTAVVSLNSVEELIRATIADQKNAEMFKIDEAIKSATIQAIKSGNLTENDLHTVYDNWDLAVELEKNSKKK